MSARSAEAAAPGSTPEWTPVTADMLSATFDHWRIWVSGGRWFASRPGSTKQSGPESLIQPVVSSGTLYGLADQLSMQEWLRRMSAAELEAVWSGGFDAAPAHEGPPR